ncbi:MAG TPA: hypothetical protein VHE81_13635 [Lacipirellulaceae bacterium]|nr:hypothetical protein [Lacipirellulaceae bacterium]
MRAAFFSAVVVSLIGHALFGCCAHHIIDLNALPSVLADRDCGHHDGVDAAPNPHHQCPCKGHSQCRGLCTYLTGPKVDVKNFKSLVQLDIAAVLPAVFDSQIATLIGAERTRQLHAEPPLRLHLFQQILLI